jgi:hypothetical protein
MKNIVHVATVFALSALLVAGCKKKEKDVAPVTPVVSGPAQVQNSVVIYFGGTWCGPCGAYGKPAKEALHNSEGEKVSIVSCQVNGGGGATDPMNNPDANAMAGVFGIKSVPSLFIGGHNDLITSVPSNSSMSSTAISTAQTVEGKMAVAASSMEVSGTGTSVSIKTQTKFFENQTEEYYLAVYLTESGLTYTQYQDMSSNKNIHDNVLRTKVTAITGDLLGSNVNNGDIIDKTFSATLDPSWNRANMSAVLVLWRKNTDGKITICNGTTVKL